ncbi:hypothetical protein M2368_003099 [Arthrobacter sp. JUb119]|nr:hypothetical protein [Arthrobacter sp. JUb119]
MPESTTAPALMHGFIDPFAPGGLEQLLAFNRAKFGDAVMSANAGGADGDAGGAAGGDKTGGGDAGTGGGGGDAGTGGDGTGNDEQLGAPGIKALAAERETVKQLKAQLAERESKIKGFEDAGKTDEQKREQELEDLRNGKSTTESELAKTQLAVLQYQVAAAKGLDLEAAERLRGSSKEELEADADAWIAKWGKASGNGVVPGAGHIGSGTEEVAPGMARMRLGYSQSPKK